MKRFTLALAAVLAAVLTVASIAQTSRLFRSAEFPQVPTSVAASTTSSLTSSNAEFGLVPNQGVGLLVTFRGTHASDTVGVQFNFNCFADATAKTTTTLFSMLANANGTNVVRVFTNVPPDFIGNIPWVGLTSIVNSNSNAYITNVSVVAFTPAETR